MGTKNTTARLCQLPIKHIRQCAPSPEKFKIRLHHLEVKFIPLRQADREFADEGIQAMTDVSDFGRIRRHAGARECVLLIMGVLGFVRVACGTRHGDAEKEASVSKAWFTSSPEW